MERILNQLRENYTVVDGVKGAISSTGQEYIQLFAVADHDWFTGSARLTVTKVINEYSEKIELSSKYITCHSGVDIVEIELIAMLVNAIKSGAAGMGKRLIIRVAPEIAWTCLVKIKQGEVSTIVKEQVARQKGSMHIYFRLLVTDEEDIVSKNLKPEEYLSMGEVVSALTPCQDDTLLNIVQVDIGTNRDAAIYIRENGQMCGWISAIELKGIIEKIQRYTNECNA